MGNGDHLQDSSSIQPGTSPTASQNTSTSQPPPARKHNVVRNHMSSSDCMRGTKVYFHRAIHEKRIRAIPGVHFFDAHRLEAQLLSAPELQIPPRVDNLPGPEGAEDAVVDPSSEEEPSTSDEEDDDTEESSDEEPNWCPPIPGPHTDPAEEEISGSAEKLETMVAQLQANSHIFFTPSSLGALPALWPQAKLTISRAPFQDKFAKLFTTIAAELWLRGCPEAIDRTFQRVARSVTIRLAEQLAKHIGSLMRHAAELATPETECLLYATYWFRPILSELIGAATETAHRVDLSRSQSALSHTPGCMQASTLLVESPRS